MNSIDNLLSDIHALESDLIAFEKKYGLRSESFYVAYISGEEPSEDSWVLDFSEWAAVYKTWLDRQADYRNEIQTFQRTHHFRLFDLMNVNFQNNIIKWDRHHKFIAALQKALLLAEQYNQKNPIWKEG